MNKGISIGIVGDFEERPSQSATNEALQGVKEYLGVNVQWEWLHTQTFKAADVENIIEKYQGILCGPGNYGQPSGAICAIRFCRENGIPFLGT